MEIRDYLAIGSLVVAALAVIVQPFTALIVAKNSRQIAVRQIISPMRQAWIDRLRDRMAELLSEISEFCEKRDGGMSVKRLLLLKWQIELMLNMTETEHQNLVSLLDDVIHLSHGQDGPGQFSAALDRTVAACRSILKIEWERVKSGDI